MIKIAVVDDEQKERDLLLQYYKDLAGQIQEEFQIETFSEGSSFLESYDYSYDLICLDIDMPGEDGLSVAKSIRKRDGQVLIVFITNMAQMAIRGYEVHALDFVVKPVNYYSFALKMRSAVNLINRKKKTNIIITTPTGIQKISTDNLYYVEVEGHYLYYHAKTGVFKQKESLKNLESKLEGLSFKRCNNCYLINLKFVDSVNKDDLEIAGNWLKISRPKKKEFLQSLANYMGGMDV